MKKEGRDKQRGNKGHKVVRRNGTRKERKAYREARKEE